MFEAATYLIVSPPLFFFNAGKYESIIRWVESTVTSVPQAQFPQQPQPPPQVRIVVAVQSVSSYNVLQHLEAPTDLRPNE